MKYVALTAVALGFAVPANAQAASASLGRAAVPALMQSMFNAADANRDGFVTAAEATAAKAAADQARDQRRRNYALRHDANYLFSASDSNRDGSLSRGEYDAMYAAIVRAHAAHASTPRQTTSAPRMGLRMDGKRFARADVNKDGRLSLQEAVAVGYFYFDRMDSNRDSLVSPAERAAYRQKYARAAG
nr:hypothetical protein [uncultured Sphingomonas sp.]